MKILKSVAIVAASLLALAGCQKAAKDTAADEAAIRASTPVWAAAYNSGDADAVAALYAEDAVMQPPGAPSAVGKAAIREFIATDSAASKAAGLTFHIPTDTTVVVSGDLAYEAGTFSVTDASGATAVTGKFLGVFGKKDGNWLLVRDTWNTDAPPAPAAEPATEAAS